MHIKCSLTDLHLPFHRFKRVRQGLGHCCCQTAVNEVLDWGEAKSRPLPQHVQVYVDCIAANRKGKGTCGQIKCIVTYIQMYSKCWEDCRLVVKSKRKAFKRILNILVCRPSA